MKKTLLLLLSAAVCLACGQKNDAAPAAGTANAAPATSTAKMNLPPDHPPMGNAAGVVPVSTAGQMPSAPAGANLLKGEVAETMNAGGYTYVKVKTAQGDMWAAVQQTTVKVGAPIAINAQMTLDNFKSESLNRTFDHIVFGTVADPNAPAAAAGAQNPHGAPAAVPAAVGNVSVPKAEGADAKTVAELWAAGPSLKDKSVTVRGKVVKFLPEIMGKNWLHLRDGSGSDAKKDNDITVVTKDVAVVGDVVVVKGTVRVDKDFGAGYKYPVIVEDAKVSK